MECNRGVPALIFDFNSNRAPNPEHCSPNTIMKVLQCSPSQLDCWTPRDVSKEKTALRSREGKHYRILIFEEYCTLSPLPWRKKKHNQTIKIPKPGFDKLFVLNIVFQFLVSNIIGRAGNFIFKRIIMISLITFSVQNQGAAFQEVFLNPKGPLYLQEYMSKYWTLLNLFD